MAENEEKQVAESSQKQSNARKEVAAALALINQHLKGREYTNLDDALRNLLQAYVSMRDQFGKPEEKEDEAPQVPADLSIFSYLLREVDCNRLIMPAARRTLGEWFNRQGGSKQIESGRIRMRRLKQIVDALYEEFWSLAGSQTNQ